jgi:hypothetical protein
MTNTLELDIAIKRAGYNRAQVAKALNLTMTTLFNKIHNKVEFKASEIAKLKALLNLSNEQRDLIFFTLDVDSESTKEATA